MLKIQGKYRKKLMGECKHLMLHMNNIYFFPNSVSHSNKNNEINILQYFHF